MNDKAFSTDPMWLVYIDQLGELYYQPFQDLTDSGTLIDPEDGEDMEVVGWTTTYGHDPIKVL